MLEISILTVEVSFGMEFAFMVSMIRFSIFYQLFPSKVFLNCEKDIGWLMEREHLFANKFDTTSPYSDAAVQCLEERF